MDEVYSLEKNFVKYDSVLRYHHEYEIMSGEMKTYTIETYSNPANKKDKVYLEEATTRYEGYGVFTGLISKISS